jgi:hypothetical protein
VLKLIRSTSEYNFLATNLNSSCSLKHQKRRQVNLKSKTVYLAVGVLLIIIAIILGAVQHFNTLGYSIYGSDDNKWYFYGLIGIIGLIGVILVVWSFMKTEAPAKTAQTAQ